MRGLWKWMAIGACVVPWMASAHDGPHTSPTDQVFKIGKNGEVKIGTDITIGNAVVRKGRYLVVHRADGDSHVLTLTTADQKREGVAVIHEVRMRLIPSREAVKTSALFAKEERDRSLRVVVVQIAGEAGDHVPEG